MDSLLRMLGWENEIGAVKYESPNDVGAALSEIVGISKSKTHIVEQPKVDITYENTNGEHVETAIIVPDVHSYARDIAAYELCMESIKILSNEYNITQVVQLGDLLEGGELSAHPHSSVYEHIPGYEEEIEWSVEDFWKRIIHAVPNAKYVQLMGNHEDRLNKFLLKRFNKPGKLSRSIYESLIPTQIYESLGIEVIPYGNEEVSDGSYALIDDVLYCVHGWSFAANAAKAHLDKMLGKSCIFGHTHRAQSTVINDPLSKRVVGAWSFGALAKTSMWYQKGQPNQHTNGFGLVHIGKNGEYFTPQHIPILTTPKKERIVVLPNNAVLRTPHVK